jgi:hypothetical protein
MGVTESERHRQVDERRGVGNQVYVWEMRVGGYVEDHVNVARHSPCRRPTPPWPPPSSPRRGRPRRQHHQQRQRPGRHHQRQRRRRRGSRRTWRNPRR